MGRPPIQHPTGPVIPEPMMLNKGNLMLRNIFNVISDVVHIACGAERHDVLDYDVDQPAADVISPTQAGCSMASGGIETKREATLV
jgi:hypothetical protein